MIDDYETYSEQDMLTFGKSIAMQIWRACALIHAVESGKIPFESAEKIYKLHGGHDFDMLVSKFRNDTNALLTCDDNHRKRGE